MINMQQLITESASKSYKIDLVGMDDNKKKKVVNVTFTMIPDPNIGRITFMASTSKEVDKINTLYNDIRIDNQIAKHLTKVNKLPFEADMVYVGAGFAVYMDMYELIKKLK